MNGKSRLAEICRKSSLIALVIFPRIAAAEPLRIGALFHLTGEIAVQGAAFQEGAELALSEEKTGELKDLEIIYHDTRYIPLDTNTGAKALAQREGLQAVLISTLTEAKTASPVLTSAKTPMLVLWDSSPDLEKLSPYLFGFGPWTPSAGELPAEFSISALKAKRAVIFEWNTEWSLCVSKFFRNKFVSLGGEIVETFTINPGELDFLTIITRAKRRHPDVAYVPIESSIVQFFSQARKMNVEFPLVTSDVITDDNIQEGGKVFDGVFQSMVADPSFKESAKMLSSYEKKYKKKCTQPLYVAWAYDAVKVVAQILRSGVRGGEEVRKALLTVKGYHGAGGTISLEGKQSSPRPAQMYKISDGKFFPVLSYRQDAEGS